jgi:DedD protein
MSDEAFHEIQLNGKQLVFLFMAATVVAVVIFLCGVMVGRGVQVPRVLAAADGPLDVVVDPTAAPAVSTAPSSEGAPLTAQETLTYAERLEGTASPAETLRSPAEITSEPPAVAEPRLQPPVTPAPSRVEAPPASVPAAPAAPPVATAVVAPPPRAAAPTSTPAAATSLAEPAGNGWVVQVAATNSRPEAEIIAKRLAGKGYPTFITTASAGVFRVRVGKYTDRREAETISGRLEREERFKPWLTR